MRRLRWRWFWLPWLLQATQPAGLEPAGAQTGEAQIGMVRSGGGQLEGGQLEAAAEEANCARVSQLLEANAEPAMLELERLARQRFGRGFSELTPEQLIQITRLSKVEGRQATAEQERLAARCDAYRQRQQARQSAAAGLSSLAVGASFLERWGREQVGGLGCSCPDFQLGGEDHAHGCPSSPLCPGQRGGPRIPDLLRGCRRGPLRHARFGPRSGGPSADRRGGGLLRQAGAHQLSAGPGAGGWAGAGRPEGLPPALPGLCPGGPQPLGPGGRSRLHRSVDQLPGGLPAA